MKYLVMECHPGWAVLLGSDGSFVKAVNLNYHVGDTVYNILPMRAFRTREQKLKRALARLCALFCTLLLIFGINYAFFTTESAILFKCEGEALIRLNRFDYVIGLKALDSGGAALIDGISSFGAKLDAVASALAEHAMTPEHPDKLRLEVFSDNEERRYILIAGLRGLFGERFGDAFKYKIEDGDDLDDILDD